MFFNKEKRILRGLKRNEPKWENKAYVYYYKKSKVMQLTNIKNDSKKNGSYQPMVIPSSLLSKIFGTVFSGKNRRYSRI